MNLNSENNNNHQNPEEVQSVASQRTGSFESLRIPNFRHLLTGNVLSNAIQWIQGVIVNWLVYDITGSGTVLGTINLISAIASLCTLLATGFLVDYFNRRKLMFINNGIFFFLTLGLGLTLLIGKAHIAYIFVFTFVVGLIQTTDWTLRQVVLFDMMPKTQTPGAMAILQTGWSLMRVLGPSLGGFFIIWFSAGGSFLVQSGFYILIGITILQMKLPRRAREGVQNSPIKNIRDGLVYLLKEPVIKIFTIIGIVLPILIIPIFSILPPIYAVQVFGDPSGKILGFLMASVGVGGIIGGVITTYLRRLEYWGRLQMASLLLLSLSLLGFAFSTTLPLAIIFLIMAGFFEVIFLTMNQTLIQLAIPDNIRGRVTAVINLTWIISPLGSLIAGAGADLLGNPKQITIIMVSVAVVVVIISYLISPTIRNYRLNQEITNTLIK